MKKLLLLISLFFASQAMAVCTSVISRPNFSANQVLTSTRLNTELNTVYARANELPGDCVTTATIDSTKFSTDLNPVLKGIKEGCLVTRSTAAIISVDKCLLAVNGKMVSTTAANTVTMACGACSAETVSTTYYVYAVTGSTGTTLTLKISTVAPNADGYNAGGDRVLARFYNNAASDIDQYSIDQWVINGFEAQKTGWITYTPTGSWVSNSTYTGVFRRVGSSIEINSKIVLAGAPTSADLNVTIPSGLLVNTSILTSDAHGGLGSVLIVDAGVAAYHGHVQTYYLTNSFSPAVMTTSGTYGVSTLITQAVPITFGNLDSIAMQVTIPVIGWND